MLHRHWRLTPGIRMTHKTTKAEGHPRFPEPRRSKSQFAEGTKMLTKRPRRPLSSNRTTPATLA
jgi:hypothetical protein